MLEPVLAHYLMEYFADNKKRKRATKSVDIPTGTLIINYICVDITSYQKYETKIIGLSFLICFQTYKYLFLLSSRFLNWKISK